MQCLDIMQNIAIVLNRPKYAGNIGSVARCAMNMGIPSIAVVDPMENDVEMMKRMSTHFAAHIVDGIEYRSTLKEALGPFSYVVGTTARMGNSSLRRITLDPEGMAYEVSKAAGNNRVALVFGSEDRGLTNEDLRYCDILVNIPTSERMRSINLSHAVMIVCYEIYKASKKPRKEPAMRFASLEERERMYGDLKEMFLKINFINPENPDYWMTNVRRFFSRTRLLAKDVKIIRGICRQVDLHGRGMTRDKRLDLNDGKNS